jgi:hypothetical protein
VPVATLQDSIAAAANLSSRAAEDRRPVLRPLRSGS